MAQSQHVEEVVLPADRFGDHIRPKAARFSCLHWNKLCEYCSQDYQCLLRNNIKVGRGVDVYLQQTDVVARDGLN
jgi:hypothetical protein